MTIERIRFEGGYPLDPTKDRKEQTLHAIVDNFGEKAALPPGEYDTGPIWARPELGGSHKTSLIVFEDGTGVHRAIPSFEHLEEKGTVIEIRKKGNIIKEVDKTKGFGEPIDPENSLFILAAPTEDGTGEALYDILFWEEDKSPHESEDKK